MIKCYKFKLRHAPSLIKIVKKLFKILTSFVNFNKGLLIKLSKGIKNRGSKGIASLLKGLKPCKPKGTGLLHSRLNKRPNARPTLFFTLNKNQRVQSIILIFLDV